jgi:glycosyltransferase involved in cell wall biosynthesis
VGKSPTRQLRARASENVIVTGFVDDVRPYMARAQVFVIPLLAGGGIRGKALEAMAMKRPIVTTTIGVEGIHLRHEESALFADTPDAFAKAVVRLFRDPACGNDWPTTPSRPCSALTIGKPKERNWTDCFVAWSKPARKRPALNPPAASLAEPEAAEGPLAGQPKSLPSCQEH